MRGVDIARPREGRWETWCAFGLELTDSSSSSFKNYGRDDEIFSIAVVEQVLTSMMIAKGTQHATAQHIPIKLTTTVAYIILRNDETSRYEKHTWRTVLTKNVENVRMVKRSRAPVQMFRNKNGIKGSLRGLPSRNASARHS